MYVTNQGSNTVSVIDSSTNTVIKTIPVGSAPQGVAYNSNNNDMYVANSNSGGVSVIDSSTNTVIKTIPVGKGPYNIAYNSNNNDMYVANLNDNTVSVIAMTQPPSHTTITSATDGNNNPVSNSGSTISASITFTVQATQGTNPIAGFQCTLDNGPVSNCSSPITYSSLSPGSHTFKVQAVDSQGNVDPTPASFSWTVVTPPSNTAITSAVDGNNNPVSNGGSTTSTYITFTVQATAGSNPITGFQCSLDGGQFNNCNANSQNQITFNNLAAGQQYTIKIRAVDSQGNVDPTPASFSWTILTPVQGAQNIITTINGMNLPKGTTTSLESSLNNAFKQLNNNNITPACNNLNAFINKVNADQTSGQLTPPQAANLIQQATSIQKAIGCSISSSAPLSSSNDINNSLKPFNEPMNGLTAGSR